MAEQFITCPKCNAQIPLTEALTGQIESTIRAQYEADAAKKTAELEKERQALAKQQKDIEARWQALDEQVDEKLKAERKKIADEKKALASERQQIEDEVAKREKELRSTLTKQLKAELAEEQAEQTKALEDELQEKTKKLSALQKQEIELRKRQRELEQKQEELELANQRKLDEERKTIEEKATKRAAEEQRLQIRQKDNLIKSMQNQIAELKRKAETGSQERQGEALEEELQELLERSFPYDTFEETKKGQRGADILQKVRNKIGKLCGSILWESKNTKDFSKAWIDKLKTDQQRRNADIGVIMSMALPKEIESFDFHEGVWITNYRSAVGLARALRQGLVEVARQKIISAGQDSIKDVLYQYITGQEFAMHIKAVVNAFNRMQADLEREKHAMLKTWKNREKQIQLVIQNVSELYGSVEGYIGGKKQLPRIEPLSLDTVASEEEEEEV